jgi:hypothetical protein
VFCGSEVEVESVVARRQKRRQEEGREVEVAANNRGYRIYLQNSTE